MVRSPLLSSRPPNQNQRSPISGECFGGALIELIVFLLVKLPLTRDSMSSVRPGAGARFARSKRSPLFKTCTVAPNTEIASSSFSDGIRVGDASSIHDIHRAGTDHRGLLMALKDERRILVDSDA